MTLEDFNDLPEPEAIEALTRCCGAHRWVNRVAHKRPYKDDADLFATADEVWAHMGQEDILEAFQHHPQIGDLDALRKKFATTATWAEGEQSGTASASEAVLQGLADGNRDYLEKFGYIFIVCATGKSAAQMLELLKARLKNDPAHELQVAAAEQAQITRLRLEKMLAS
jgi:2-oxo-4-hydroxy-4-carboxy-5-ureidoimidazoline decarboxylase